jgi:outer membrane protein TolC
MRTIRWALTLGLAVHSAQAEPTKAMRLTLPDCVGRALAAAPDIAAARARLDVRRAKLDHARAARYLPEAGLLNSFGFVPSAKGKLDGCRGNTCDAAGRENEWVSGSKNLGDIGPFNKVEIGFVQPIWTAGKLTAGINAATAGVEAQMAASEGKSAEVVEQTKTLYYNVLLARSMANVLDDTREAFATALEKARERRERHSGKVTELDILNLRVAAAEISKEQPRLEAGAESALEALRRLMGFAPDAAIDLADTRLEPEAVDLPPLEDYESRLFAHSPEWKEVSAGVSAKTEEVKRAEADYYPNVFVKGGFEYGYAPDRRRQTNPFVYDDYNYLRGPGGVLGIGWNLNFHMTAAKVATKRAELLEIEAMRRGAQTGLPVQLRDAYRKVLQHKEQVARLDDGRRAGRAILTLAVANFDLGIGEPIDILSGLGNYSRVSGDYFESVRDYNLALAALARVMGETANPTATAAVAANPVPEPDPDADDE